MSTGSFTAISAPWSLIKSFVDKGTNLQYFEDDKLYSVRTQNGSIVYECELYKAGADIDNIPDDNTTNLADFENNYKANANGIEQLKVKAEFEEDQQLNVNIQGQALSNKLRYDKMVTNQSLTKDLYTTVYTYSGAGQFYGFYGNILDNSSEVKVTIDGEDIIADFEIDDIPTDGPGNSGGGAFGSPFLKRSSSTDFAMEPPMAIQFSTSVTIQIKAHGNSSNKRKLANGYVVITKES